MSTSLDTPDVVEGRRHLNSLTGPAYRSGVASSHRFRCSSNDQDTVWYQSACNVVATTMALHHSSKNSRKMKTEIRALRFMSCHKFITIKYRISKETRRHAGGTGTPVHLRVFHSRQRHRGACSPRSRPRPGGCDTATV